VGGLRRTPTSAQSARGVDGVQREEIPAWVLPVLMLGGATLGIAAGAALGERADQETWKPVLIGIGVVGQIFLALLKALVVPLVGTSVLLSVASMGSLRVFGRVAARTVAYFVATTVMAVSTGLVLVNAIRPGAHTTVAPSAPPDLGVSSGIEAVAEVILGMFPPNLVEAAAEGNVLGLIVFAVLAGAILANMEDRARPLVAVVEVANAVLLRLVQLVVWLAPIGIFGLVAERLARAGGGAHVWTELQALGWYAATVLGGLAIHALVVLPLLLLFFARRNPVRYAAGMGQAVLTAFGTASSAATMGVTLACATKRNGVSVRAAEFVIPLGTTINMDGTALYEAVAVLFIAQMLGVELGLVQQLVVLFTATLAAIGAAAIPEAGLVTMVLVLGAVGLPADAVGLILSIDWVLDRFRTAVNVWGDSVGAAIIDRHMPTVAPRDFGIDGETSDR
jgi:Na+/H+-dicarboxylate symporter